MATSRLASELVLSLIDKVTAPARNVSASVARMREEASRNARKMDAMRGRMVDAAAAGYALSRALSAPVKTAIAFEEAMADVAKVVDFETPDGLRQMSRDIVEMSTQVPMTAKGIAEIVAAAGQAGMKGRELKAFAEIAAKVGIAFDITADQAGEGLAKIKTALGLTVAETQELADAINHLSNSSASAAPDLLDFMRRVGSVGAQYGFTKEQTVAIGSAMIAAGAQADVASTSFRNVGKALARGSGATKRQKEAFRDLGLEAGEVARRLQDDAVGTLQKVIERIRALPEHLQASTISDLFGDEARAIMPLINNAQLLTQALDAVAQKANFLGSSQREYEVRAETTANKLQLLRNQAAALGIAIGSALLPAITQFTDAVGPIIGAVADLASRFPQATTAIVGLAASLIGLRVATIAARWAFLFMKGGVLDVGIAAGVAAGKVAAAMKKIRLAVLGATMLSAVGGGGLFATLVAGAASASTAISAAAAGIATAIGGITAPILGVIFAVGALAFAVYKYWEPIRAFVGGFASEIATALDPVIAYIADFGARLAAAAGSWATEKLIDLGAALGLDEATVRAALDHAVTIVTGSLGRIKAAITALPSQVGNWIADLFSINDYSATAEAEFRSAGARAARALIAAFKALPQRMAEIGRAIMSGLLQGLKNGAQAVLSYVANIASRIKSSVSGAVTGAFGRVKNLVTGGPDSRAVDGARAAGGPVVGGRTYLVGERGPELVTPSRSGYVHDARASRAMAGGRGGVNVRFGDIIIHNPQNAETIAAELERKVRDALSGIQADVEWSIA